MKPGIPDTFATGADDGGRAAKARLNRLTDLERRLIGQTSGAQTLVRDSLGRVFQVPVALPTGAPEIEEWDRITPQQRIASEAPGDLDARSGAILRRIDALTDGMDDVPMFTGLPGTGRLVLAQALFVGYALTAPFSIAPITKQRWMVKGGRIGWSSYSESEIWGDSPPATTPNAITLDDTEIEAVDGWIALRIQIQPQTFVRIYGDGALTRGGSFDVVSAEVVATDELRQTPSIESLSSTFETINPGTPFEGEVTKSDTNTYTPVVLLIPLGRIHGRGETPHVSGPATGHVSILTTEGRLSFPSGYPDYTRPLA